MPLLLVLISVAQEVCATRCESRTIIEAEAEYFKGPFHKYFAYCRYESSYFVHILYIKLIYIDEPDILSPATSKKLRHGILSCFVGSLKIVINWREPLNDSLPV